VLANHREAEVFHGLNVGAQRFVGRRRVESIRPPALIQRTELEDGLAVQRDPREPFAVLGQANFSHAEVAIDSIDLSSRSA
jgi:hypothetical protein